MAEGAGSTGAEVGDARLIVGAGAYMVDVIRVREAITNEGVVRLSVRFLHEDGTPISEKEWAIGSWIDVTTADDPADTKRFARGSQDTAISKDFWKTNG